MFPLYKAEFCNVGEKDRQAQGQLGLVGTPQAQLYLRGRGGRGTYALWPQNPLPTRYAIR